MHHSGLALGMYVLRNVARFFLIKVEAKVMVELAVLAQRYLNYGASMTNMGMPLS